MKRQKTKQFESSGSSRRRSPDEVPHDSASAPIGRAENFARRKIIHKRDSAIDANTIEVNKDILRTWAKDCPTNKQAIRRFRNPKLGKWAEERGIPAAFAYNLVDVQASQTNAKVAFAHDFVKNSRR